jgi:haloacetate dehalogenase
MCADYRAGATTDRVLDEADRAAHRKIAVPLRFLWAETGFPAQTGDPAAIWRNWADEVTNASCKSGHFAAEEAPRAVLDMFATFFAEGCRALSTA